MKKESILKRLKRKTRHPQLNWYQQIFSGIQLSDSRGRPSMHITTLWYVGILPVVAAVVAEIWRVAARPQAELATGFWALVSTLVTVVIAANGVKEYQMRKMGQTAPAVEPADEEPAPSDKQEQRPSGVKKLVLPAKKGELDFGPN